MTYVIGAAVGLILGCIIGWLKNRFLWETYLKRDGDSVSDNEAGALYGRMLASNAVNFGVLLLAFLLRNIIPFDGIALLIGLAVALTVMNRILTTAGRKGR